jgi:hypothetical protein
MGLWPHRTLAPCDFGPMEVLLALGNLATLESTTMGQVPRNVGLMGLLPHSNLDLWEFNPLPIRLNRTLAPWDFSDIVLWPHGTWAQ